MQRVTVLERGEPVREIHQIDPSRIERSKPGLLRVDSAAALVPGPRLDTFFLAGDTSGDAATYDETYETRSERNLSAGFKAFNAELTLTATSTMDESLALTYELRGGHDYMLHVRAVPEPDGLSWTVQQ